MIPCDTGIITMRIVLAFGLALMSLPAAGQPRSPSACIGQTVPDRLQGLTSEGDLILASIGPAKLTDVRLPDASPYRDLALAWLHTRAQQAILVEASGNRDRWNRLPVRIRPPDADSQDPGLGHGLVAAGLALVDPGPAASLCQPILLSLEEEARRQRLGLWAEASYNPIAVEDTERLRARIGSFVLVEGRVRSIGERAQRTYLNFGGHWAEDFTIIIPRKTWKTMTERGWSAEALKGQRIRARGILQPWQGTALTVVIPEMIERLESVGLPR